MGSFFTGNPYAAFVNMLFLSLIHIFLFLDQLFDNRNVSDLFSLRSILDANAFFSPQQSGGFFYCYSIQKEIL